MSDEAISVGARLLLRPPTPDDQDDWSRLVDVNREHLAGWISLPSEADDPGARALFASMLSAATSERCEKFMIVDRSEGTFLGVLNLNEIVRGSFWSAYVGYWIGKAHQRRGLMTEALALGLRHAFEGMGLHRIEANLQPGNRASRALVCKLGFVQEGYSERYLRVDGEWRDHERWAITVERWRQACPEPSAKHDSDVRSGY
ncbi:MAG: GNAT family N-acetyltransferase [Nannocystaceae bacterium]|nr:GNAT family N-acetyltransferase [Nannocystaceae bacterium]